MKQVNSIQAGSCAPLGYLCILFHVAQRWGVTSAPPGSDIGPRTKRGGAGGIQRGTKEGRSPGWRQLIHWETKEGFEHWERMWKEQQKKKRAGFGAGEERSEGGRK